MLRFKPIRSSSLEDDRSKPIRSSSLEDDRSKPIRSSSLEDYADRRLDWLVDFHQSSWDMVGLDPPLSSRTHQQSTIIQINIYKLINSLQIDKLTFLNSLAVQN